MDEFRVKWIFLGVNVFGDSGVDVFEVDSGVNGFGDSMYLVDGVD